MEVMRFMRYKIIGNIGSIASVIALFFVETNWYWWRVLGIILGLAGSLYLIIAEVLEYKKSKPIICKNDTEIRKYMYDWIKTSGKVNVFSRDLSWVNDEIKIMMQCKGDDLSVCAEKDSQLIKDLRQAHVNVYLYGGMQYEPISRFTIIRANKPQKQIAIAAVSKLKYKEKHIIYESSNEHMDEWLLAATTDLVELTKSVDKLITESNSLKGIK